MHKHIVIDARIRRTSTGRYVDRLIEHLQVIDHNNRYTILTQPDDPWRPTAPNFSKVNTPYAQFSFNPIDQIRFAKQLRQLRPDLVHFPMNQQPILYKGTVVTSVMDLTMLRFTRPGKTFLPIFWLKMLGYRFLFWHSIKKSKALITISEFVKNDLETHYPWVKGKITVTHCASEPPVANVAKQPANITKPFIMHVGSPFPHKNIERLIDAFEILAKDNPNLGLILAGKKEYYFEQLQKQINASPAKDKIRITGYIDDAELKWLYQNAEAYVLPSLSEGFGLPGLEAMVHGCPVISSNATCLPEVYGDAAEYFDPLDVAEMAKKIDYVINNKNRADNLRQLGTKQANIYSWKRMATQTLQIYNQILDTKK